ncbi:MAG: UvrD-helicase domain-containing protein [Acidimicrobiales bacterium]
MTAAELSSLVDDAARRSIRSDLGATLFVEAGAGSGKTTALVGRIVALVARGLGKITGIAAITFTEAAAGELRIAVRDALAQRANSASATPDERRRCGEALGRIDEAAISTIHGFCHRVLAAHPIEAGLPPRFEVLDEVSESIEWQRRWSTELDLLAGVEEMGELLSLAFVLDVSDKRIEALAKAVDEEWHRSRSDAPELVSVVARIGQRATTGVGELFRLIEIATAARSGCSDPEDKLLGRLDELSEFAVRLRAASQWQEAVALIRGEGAVFSRAVAGQKQAWGGDAARVRQLLDAVCSERENLVQDLFDLVVGSLAHYFEARAHAVALDRRGRGVLTFHDILVLTRDVLCEHAGVLSAVRRRFSHLLIDEFQDTDTVQLEIARLIGTESGVWTPGRCFFVGDPKQSIYRFRGADLASYESARAEIVGEEATSLTSNFRSAPGIIAFVNSCFESLLGERFHSLDAARRLAVPALEGAGHGGPGEGPPVHIVGGELPAKALRREQRRIESEDCCGVIERAVFEEAWAIEDASPATTRPARLGDVAILVPRRTGLVELEAALDHHGIAYRIESASLIFKSQEVRDVLHLARAIAEPGDQAALVAALRSPAYSIGDDDLVKWAAAKGPWSIEESPSPRAVNAAPRVAAGLSSLAELRSRLSELGPVGTLSFAVRERRLLQLASDRPHAREAWRRIRYLLERARVFVEAGGGGLSEFADWIDGQVRGGLRSSESVVPDADEDVVRIMTVHGAKGLEFPITILCGFGTTDETAGDRDTVLRSEKSTEICFTKALQTSGYEDLRAGEQLLETEEATRLLYVAATRARDHLVICGHHVKGPRPSLGERLVEVAGEHRGAWHPMASCLDDKEVAAATGPLAGLSSPSPPSAMLARAQPQSAAFIGSIDTVGAYEAWSCERVRLIATSTRQASVRATEIASLAGLGELSEPTGTLAVPRPDTGEDDGLGADAVVPSGLARRRRGAAGTKIGRAVHASLQSLPFDDAVALARGDDPGSTAARRLEAIAHAQARVERIGDRAREVSRLAKTALRSPAVREAFASGTAHRETYVATPWGATVIDGYVDLCFTAADGSLVVIDYKTDSVRNRGEVSERAAAYELQAAAYALALREATGRPVSRCVLVFLSPPGEPLEHELSGTALAERIDTVGRVVGAFSS